jgi:hypothetical protein
VVMQSATVAQYHVGTDVTERADRHIDPNVSPRIDIGAWVYHLIHRHEIWLKAGAVEPLIKDPHPPS